jgi:hypothetical protein
MTANCNELIITSRDIGHPQKQCSEARAGSLNISLQVKDFYFKITHFCQSSVFD